MNKKNRRGVFRAVTACALSAAMLIAGGCGKPGGPGGQRGPYGSQGGTIYVIGKQPLSFWDDVRKGAEDAGEEFGYDIVYRQGTSDNDYSSQEADIQDAIKKKAKAIVIAPNGKTELNSAFEEAEKAGIKIININSKADYDGVVTFVRCSDKESGSLAARNAVKLLKAKDPELAGLKNIAITSRQLQEVLSDGAKFDASIVDRFPNPEGVERFLEPDFGTFEIFLCFSTGKRSQHVAGSNCFV